MKKKLGGSLMMVERDLIVEEAIYVEGQAGIKGGNRDKVGREETWQWSMFHRKQNHGTGENMTIC